MWAPAALVALVAATLGACQQAPVPPRPPMAAEPPAAPELPSAASAPAAPRQAASAPPFTGRVWVATDVGAAPGTLRIFLHDGTMLMDSCVEGYRLARWRSTGEDGVEWEEDTARIEAEVLEATTVTLRLRLTLRGGESRDESYRAATVPYVCPDTR
jgi:hypothetical protein